MKSNVQPLRSTVAAAAAHDAQGQQAVCRCRVSLWQLQDVLNSLQTWRAMCPTTCIAALQYNKLDTPACLCCSACWLKPLGVDGNGPASGRSHR